MHGPHRHSVWTTIFGIVVLGAVLLGGAGYLLYSVGGGAADGLGGGAPSSGGVSAAARAPQAGGGPVARSGSRDASPGLSSPLRGNRARPGPSGTAAPFSDDWQSRATPDLTGPTGASSSPSRIGAPSGEGQEGSTSRDRSGPSIASRAPPGKATGQTGSGIGRSDGAGWQAEAQRFAGRARALSNQLEQMNDQAAREKSQTESAPSEDPPSGEQTTADAKTSSSSGPGLPGDPNQVPIGGLEWLAAAGAAYALRRLGVQSEGQ